MLIAWPVAAFGGNQLLCHMMGRVITSCCCAPASAAHRGTTNDGSVAELRSRSCCERLDRADREALPGIRGVEVRVHAPTFVATAPAFTALPEPERRTLRAGPLLARAPPTATPIFLKNCSLLS
jgi:hypothetical protein